MFALNGPESWLLGPVETMGASYGFGIACVLFVFLFVAVLALFGRGVFRPCSLCSSMAKSLAFCSCVPLVKHPRKDLATPREQLFAKRVASRLRQRAVRSSRSDSNIIKDFPWNPASLKRVSNPDYVPPTKKENNRLPCAICLAGSFFKKLHRFCEQTVS